MHDEIRERVYGIRKNAWPEGMGITLGFSKGIAETAVDAGVLSAGLVAAGLGLTGIGMGWAASKVTAAGDNELDTVRKEYQNERASSDIGYLSAKLQQEYAARKEKLLNAPKAARIL